jgi:hypothetical protein
MMAHRTDRGAPAGTAAERSSLVADSQDAVGAGLVVVGVGRSGTSVATELAVGIGLRGPGAADVMVANQFNPTGYWESVALARFCDQLLAEWGASWWTVPENRRADSFRHLVAKFGSQAVDQFTAVYGPEPYWVWKDPRLTLLLPFWAAVIDVGPVLVPFRDPAAVAASISRRDGLGLEQSLGVWERHTRLLLRAVTGHHTLFAGYERLRADPTEWEDRLVSFCSSDRFPVRRSGRANRTVIAPTGPAQVPALTEQQQELAQIVLSCSGEHSRFVTPSLPDPSPGLES